MMRDYRLPLVLAVPAALAILGVIWMMRRKSDGDKKQKKEQDSSDKKDQKRGERLAEQKAPRRGENDGVTITQRKIPESLARDRGDADLLSSPDVRAGAGPSQKVTTSEKGDLSVAEKQRVENLVSSAMGRGLQEAKLQLSHDSKEDPSEVSWCSQTSEESWISPLPQRGDDKAESPINAEKFTSTKSVALSSTARPETQESKNLTSTSLLSSSPSSKPLASEASTVSDTKASVVSSAPPSSQPQASGSSSSQELKAQKATDLSAESHTSSSATNESVSMPAAATITVAKQDSSTKPSDNSSAASKDTATARSDKDTVSSAAVSGDKSSISQQASSSTAAVDIVSKTCTGGLESQPRSIDSGIAQGLESLPSASSSEISEQRLSVSEWSDLGDRASVAPSGASDVSGRQMSSVSPTKEDSPEQSVSPVCDSQSEGSNDSGRGYSDHENRSQVDEPLVHYDFNMPSELCGRFIGKQGKNINYLKSKTGANVSLTNNPFTSEFQICQVIGTQSEVDDALCMIRRKFPTTEYPHLTMQAINLNPVPEQQIVVPEGMQLSLPEGVSVEVYVSAIVDAGHVFVQQPTHRSFMSLEKLGFFLGTVYSQDPNIPPLPLPVECGVICVCEADGAYYRAMVMTPEDENGECQVKFVDYGGFAMLPVASLKQIRTDFMTLPFQAVECFMANVTPLQGEEGFSSEAGMALMEMTECKVLQCQVVARTETGVPFIHLYEVDAQNNTAVMINRALVNSRHVRWIEILERAPLEQ